MASPTHSEESKMSKVVAIARASKPIRLATGGWFDCAKVKSEWKAEIGEHERGGTNLFLTAGGNWVTCRWSLYEDEPDVYERVDPREAYRHLLALSPGDARKHFPEYFEGDEI